VDGKSLHGFKGPSDGANPNGGLIFDSKGRDLRHDLRRRLRRGDCGAGGCGTVCSCSSREHKGRSLDRGDASPLPTPGVSGAAKTYGRGDLRPGSLYGTTIGGGSSGQGTIFELFPRSQRPRVLYRFQDGMDGKSTRAPWCSTRGATYMGPRPVVGVSEVELFFRLQPASVLSRNTFTKSLDLGEDRVGGCRPNERPGVLVVILTN